MRVLTVSALILAATLTALARPAPIRAPARSPYCTGPYANDQAALAPEARKQEERTRYTFCVRSVATYQCAFYGADGSLVSRREVKSAHGTAFAFRREGTWTYFLTNEHVVEWPFVTSKDTPVEGISYGCKRIGQKVFIVDDENDAYGRDDQTLDRVVVDAELDVAVLKAQIKVDLIPFSFGQSAALRVGNAVRVRGFPLGAFQAVHGGKVISPREPDRDGKWDHIDFVIDAQLSTGNSGSPVLAVSCKTGKFELVGIYHAGYVHGPGLNVVVGIDEFRELMTTLKPRARRKVTVALGSADRKALELALRSGKLTPFFPYGGHSLGLRLTSDGRILYDFYPKRFPLVDWRLAVIEEMPAPGYGRIGRIWFGNEQGLAELGFSELKAPEQTTIASLVEAVRRHLNGVQQYRLQEPIAKRSRAGLDRLQQIEREISQGQGARNAQMRSLVELAGNHAPGVGRGLPLSATVTPPSTVPKPPGPALAKPPGPALAKPPGPAPARPAASTPPPRPRPQPKQPKQPGRTKGAADQPR
jgi:serine protease Do